MALIMVADDAPDILILLTDILQARGHQVVTVPDGVQMIEKAKDWKPHLIIADLMMPGVYGSAAYKSLQNDPVTAKIPVLFLTALSPDQARKVVPENPLTRLMHKPLELAPFMDAINKLLAAAASAKPQ